MRGGKSWPQGSIRGTSHLRGTARQEDPRLPPMPCASSSLRYRGRCRRSAPASPAPKQDKGERPATPDGTVQYRAWLWRETLADGAGAFVTIIDPGTSPHPVPLLPGAPKVQRLPHRDRIAQASANQRKGRCGRVADEHLPPPLLRGGFQ